MAKRMTKAEKQLEKDIAVAYCRLSQGKNINIMLIPKLYAEVRAAVTGGTPLDEAVMAAITKYCQDA